MKLIRCWLQAVFAKAESAVEVFPNASTEEKNINSARIFLRQYIKKIWPYVVVASTLTASIAMVELLFFAFLGKFLNLMPGGADVRKLAWVLIFYLAVPALNLAQNIFSYQVLAESLPARFTYQIHQVVLRRDARFFLNFSSAEISAKIDQTATAIKDVVTSLLDSLLYLIVFFIGIIVAVYRSDWLFFIPLILWLFSYSWIATYFIRQIDRRSQEYANKRSQQTGAMTDAYSNIAALRVFSSPAHEGKTSELYIKQKLLAGQNQYRLITLFSSGLYVLNTLLLLTTLTISAIEWKTGKISFGGVAVAVALVFRISSFSYWMMWEMANFLTNVGTLKDGLRALIPTVVSKSSFSVNTPSSAEHCLIEFEDVSFRYPNSQTDIFRNLNLRITPGEKIGVVGKSGCGKSTLLSLLLSVYRPGTGQVFLNGEPVSTVSAAANISIAAQDSLLLKRTLFQNLIFDESSKLDYKFELIIRCTGLKSIGASNREFFVGSMLNSPIGENARNLSGGQRQRVSVARALLKDTPVIIFDEATSALDSDSEQALLKNIMPLLADKTVISVAHRLSSLFFVDRIIVLDRGMIVEDGAHRELIKSNGIYSAMWKKQSV